MAYTIPQPTRSENTSYSVHKELFSREECKEIIELHKSIEKQPATIGARDPKLSHDKARRSSELYWIEWNANLTPLFDRIVNNVFCSNQKWWGFGLAGLNEPLQLTHYKAKDNGHYTWHEDWSEAPGFSHRKLSGVILLSDDFEGGKFEFLHQGVPAEMTVGSMILFPSFRTHRVNKVTKGERWSLVFWVSGPPFA